VSGRSSGDAEARWIRAVGAMWRRDGLKSWRRRGGAAGWRRSNDAEARWIKVAAVTWRHDGSESLW
jgi:hypothetical protein